MMLPKDHVITSSGQTSSQWDTTTWGFCSCGEVFVIKDGNQLSALQQVASLFRVHREKEFFKLESVS